MVSYIFRSRLTRLILARYQRPAMFGKKSTPKQAVNVTFQFPDGRPPVTVQGGAGETLLEIAIGHDVPMQHACGGFCACTTCHVYVKDGAAHLSPQEDEESDRIETALEVGAASRLSCQTRVNGDCTVAIVNLDG